jgi:4'-phosphopantetheinyl transferase
MPYPTVISCATLPPVTWHREALCDYTDGVAVFRLPVSSGAAADSLLARLSPDEVSRAQRYHREADRQRFIYGRVILRTLLGRYTGQNPEGIQLIGDANKKPCVMDKSGIQFNVSHAGNWILWAIGRVSVGVDVEEIKPVFSFDDIVAYSFSPEEQRHILAHPYARRLFYQLWTRKEALVKATGQGLTDFIDRIPCLDGEHHRADDGLQRSASWSVRSFSVADGYPGAIAHGGPPEVIRFYTIDEASLTLHA